jgi:C-terminal processing protease CtpA/Prc
MCLCEFSTVQAGKAAESNGLKGYTTLIEQLGSKNWEERESSQKSLTKQLLKVSVIELKPLAAILKTEKDPEIYYRLKKVLEDYYYKKVYNPNKKHGFIGLQLAQGGTLKIKGKEYTPIDIIKPQAGFPGEKAGIKEGDQILQVNDCKCSTDFSLRDFILYVADLSPGDEITLTLYSNKAIKKTKIILVARPKSMQSPELQRDKREYFIIWLKKLLR